MHYIILTLIAVFNFDLTGLVKADAVAKNTQFQFDNLSVLEKSKESQKPLEGSSAEESFFGQDTSNDSKNFEGDLIEQLRKEEEVRQEALKPDLESLGLDELDEIDKKILKEKTVNKVKKEDKLPDIKLPEIVVKKNFNVVSETKSLTQALEEAPKKLPEVKKIEEKKSAPKIIVKNQVDNSIKKLSSVETPKVAADKKEEAKQDKVEAKEQKIAAKLKEKQRLRRKKIEELRKQYIEYEYDENSYEGVDDYGFISKIVPKEKVSSRFIGNKVPPPILSRFRGQQNRHHPFVMNYAEKAKFVFQAIAENRIADFNSMYSLLQKPNIKNSQGDTLLTFAVLMQKYDAISSILSKGANPDLTNGFGYSPLNIAIEMNDFRSAKLLVDMGANINLTDSLKRTYLMQSSRMGALLIVDLLIRKGVDIDAFDTNGLTALSVAYKNNQEIVAKYLLKHRAKSYSNKSYRNEGTPMVDELFNKWR
ncbi:MAG: hypothetical protein ACJAW3_000555 [Lentimonas sp.]|jgi:hypothetical protein